MKKLIFGLFLLLCFLFIFSSPSFAKKIWTLGDSITFAPNTSSYRLYLQQKMKAEGFSTFDFVGTQVYQTYANFDPQHQGMPGFRADEIYNSLNTWLAQINRPDIVLLHIGHNDCFQNETPESTITDIENIVDRLRNNNPDVVIIIAQIIKSTTPTVCRDTVNSLIPGIATRKSTSRSPIIIVDMNETFVPSTMLVDNTHPNNLGNETMAQAWYDAMLPYLTESTGGTNYYVDCSRISNGNGSYASPWNNLASINAKSFNRGDNLYFKVNTTCFLNNDSDRVQVNWGGTNLDRAVIGAYYGNGLFGLGGNNRPIIDGRNNQYPGSEQGAIDIRNQSYVTVKDLKIQYAGRIGSSGTRGIRVTNSTNINIDNNHVWRSHGGSLLYAQVNTGQILNNTFQEAGHPSYSGVGAAVELTAANIEGATTNILIKGNDVSNSKHEGIGLYKKVTNCTIENNVVRDIITGFIYIDASRNNIIRHNIVYESTDKMSSRFDGGMGIAVGNEEARDYVFMGNNRVYGNIVIGTNIGISIGCQIKNRIPDALCHQNTKIYNNTLVDNNSNLTLWRPDTRDSIDIRNNLLLITSQFSDGKNIVTGSGGNSPSGVTWSHNLFNGSGSPLTGNASTNMITADPELTKQSGWRNIVPEDTNIVSGNACKLTASSPAINSGQSLGSEYSIDFFGSRRPHGSAFDIGAHEYGGTSVPIEDTVAPVITSFSLRSTSSSLTVPITSLSATDNVGVTGYYKSQSSTKPAVDALGWTVTKPINHTFDSEGTKTLYLWAKDANGNISSRASSTTVITIPTCSTDPSLCLDKITCEAAGWNYCNGVCQEALCPPEITNIISKGVIFKTLD